MIKIKPIKLDNKELVQAVKEGKEPYVLIENKRFMLFEVDQRPDSDFYEVTDPEEKQEILAALEENNPILSEKEIDDMLIRHPRQKQLK